MRHKLDQIIIREQTTSDKLIPLSHSKCLSLL